MTNEERKSRDINEEKKEGPEIVTERHATTERRVNMEPPATLERPRVTPREEVKTRPEMYMEAERHHERTSLPVIGGILMLVAGLLNLGAGLGVAFIGDTLASLYGLVGFSSAVTAVPFIVLGAVSIIGGIAALMRRIWWLALIGGIASVFPTPGWLFGVPSLILVSLAKPEFD